MTTTEVRTEDSQETEPAELITVTFEFCDECGPSVRALGYFALTSGILTYCGHHTTKHEQALTDIGASLFHDEREKR